MLDYYKILNIHSNANQDEIKKAYRLAALFWHPDKNPNPNASLKFIEIAEAYQILSNAEKRKVYDELFQETNTTDLNYADNSDCFSKNNYKKNQYEDWVEEARDFAKNNLKNPIDKILTESFHFINQFGFLLLIILGIIFYIIISKN